MTERKGDVWDDTPEEQHWQMEQSILRYQRAMHAVQTGVALEMSMGLSNAHEPKHLRVGVNSAMIEHGALVHFLVRKGIMTWPEWFEILADAAEQEQHVYEENIGAELR